MTTLKEWIDANAKRPLGMAVGVVLFLQVGILMRMADADYSAQLRRIAGVVETASLGIQQENRPLVESALLAGLHDSDAAAVALCRSGQADILYPPSTADLCGAKSAGFLRWKVRRTIAGMPGLQFAFLVDGRRTFASVTALFGMSTVLILAVLGILAYARRRFQDEVLTPFYHGLSEGKPLGISELEELRRRNQEFHALSRKQAASEARLQLSAQVAHDICSPLAALDSVVKALPQMPEKKRLILLGAAGRIRDIAQSLLEKHWKPREAVAPAAEPAEAARLSCLIEAIIAEKRTQFQPKAGVRIGYQVERGAETLEAAVQPVEFQRMLSNLINNALEALEKGKGAVMVSLAAAEGKAILKVQDDGKGIQADVLAKLGRRGETYGKAGGSGLGLYHAKTCAESWGGSLEIASEPGAGACVTVRLPLAVRSKAGPDAVLLDDSPLVRLNWEVAAESKGKKLAAFTKPADFLAAAANLPKETAIYLDSDLGDNVEGEAIAKDLHGRGFSNLYLATGHAPDSLPAMPWIKQVVGKEPPWN
jgi:signal transduction histidine kinase